MTEIENIIKIQDLGVTAGKLDLLRGVNIEIPPNQVFGIIGPSGAGKSTLLRCINRLADLDRGLKIDGNILLHGKSIRNENADDLRLRIGMLFQQPVVFPTSILKNTLFGVRHHRKFPRSEWHAVAEQALREVALWDEVKDRLHAPAMKLSAGQQQRICLARTLAVNPEVILMDEPTSALDPKSTLAIEDLIRSLKSTRTIVLVTHDLDQARRLCDQVAFLTTQSEGFGHVACSGPTDEILKRTDLPELNDFLRTDAGKAISCC